MKGKHVHRYFVMVLIVFMMPWWVWADQGPLPQVTGEPVPGAQNARTTEPMTDIHDIRGPLLRGIDPVVFVWAVLGLLAVLAIIALMRRRKRKADIPTVVPEPMAEDWAYGQLEKIAELLTQEGRVFYFRLSEILRGYIEKRFAVNAMEMTSEELVPKVSAMDLEAGLKNGICDLIRFSDPVKYAKAAADVSQMRIHHDLVKAFVRGTTPEIPDHSASDPGSSGEKIK